MAGEATCARCGLDRGDKVGGYHAMCFAHGHCRSAETSLACAERALARVTAERDEVLRVGHADVLAVGLRLAEQKQRADAAESALATERARREQAEARAETLAETAALVVKAHIELQEAARELLTACLAVREQTNAEPGSVLDRRVCDMEVAELAVAVALTGAALAPRASGDDSKPTASAVVRHEPHGHCDGKHCSLPPRASGEEGT